MPQRRASASLAQRPRPGQPDRGASLVEVLISLGLIGLLLPAILSGAGQASLLVEEAHVRQEANRFLAEQLEVVRREPFSETGGYPELVPPGEWTISISDPVTITTTFMEEGLQLVTVTVSYRGQAVVQAETYKADER